MFLISIKKQPEECQHIYNLAVLGTLGCRPIMSKNLPGHWAPLGLIKLIKQIIEGRDPT